MAVTLLYQLEQEIHGSATPLASTVSSIRQSARPVVLLPKSNDNCRGCKTPVS